MAKSKDQLKIGVLLSYLNLAISSIIPFVYTPVMLRILGQNEYGCSLLRILPLGTCHSSPSALAARSCDTSVFIGQKDKRKRKKKHWAFFCCCIVLLQCLLCSVV